MDFPDSACELSLLTILILNFHMNTTFTWHLSTSLQETGLNHTKKLFLNEVTIGSHIVVEVSRDT